jgi:2-polyprenyl-3-methyl-5-hydroxy-6-metoxy-1,4-benzoquinol methylase
MKKHNYIEHCVCANQSELKIEDNILRNSYSLATCGKCNFKFTYPRPNIDFLIDYYNSISSVRFYKFSNERCIKDSKGIYSDIKKYKPEAKTVLEIGGSTGYYLNGLKLRGYDVIGSELSADAVKLAKEWYNIKMYEAEFPPTSYEGSFDVIIIHHVIEHVIDPINFIAVAKKYLSKNGIIIIETPNVNSIGIKMFGRHYPVFCPPGHLNYFSITTIKELLGNGSVAKLITTSNSGQSLYNFANATLSLLSIKRLMNNVISREQKVETNQKVSTLNNSKYSVLVFAQKISKILQLIIFPIFWTIDKLNMGENLNLIIRNEK